MVVCRAGGAAVVQVQGAEVQKGSVVQRGCRYGGAEVLNRCRGGDEVPQRCKGGEVKI